jgi:hypothetical protein
MKTRKLRKASKRLASRIKDWENLETKKGYRKPGAMK